MMAPVHHQESGDTIAIEASASSSPLDYSKVRAYWKKATPSILGPYMMDGFGFPASAGKSRFFREQEAVARAIKNLPSRYSVLDLGSGVGFWTEYFSHRFAHVVSVEASPILYSSLTDRCSRYQNVTTCNDDVLSFEPQEVFGLVFLGGLLMYLNEHDAEGLLKKLAPSLEPGALILCRESTVRNPGAPGGVSGGIPIRGDLSQDLRRRRFRRGQRRTECRLHLSSDGMRADQEMEVRGA